MPSDSAEVMPRTLPPCDQSSRTHEVNPASHMPGSQPIMVPRMGMPEKNSVRRQSLHWRMRARPPRRGVRIANRIWMTTPIVRQTVRFLPYHHPHWRRSNQLRYR